MKKIGLLAAAAVLGITTAGFAANPFSDVSPNDWAYQSVEQLAAAGVINGYPDGTFKGQNNITRYEMAQMVAKAMANQSRANAEQQAMINRLADEFSSELNTLGVRVNKLENQMGNFSFSGDARLLYLGLQNKGHFDDPNKKSYFESRIRLTVENQLNDNTKATARLVLQNEFGNVSDGSNAGFSNVVFDQAYITHNFGENMTAEAGRMPLFIGEGLLYDDAFDGAKLTIGSEKFSVTGAYGFPVAGDLGDNQSDHSVTLAQIDSGAIKNTHLSAFYLKGNNGFNDLNGNKLGTYGFGLTTTLAEKLWINGEWAKNDKVDNGKAWTAGIGYGAFDMAEKGSWDVKVQYFDEDINSPVMSSTWNQQANQDYKGWMATVDYTLMKNVSLNAYYGFSGKEKSTGRDADDMYRVELNYLF